MIVHRIPQRSAEWHALRLGRITGSRAADVFAFSEPKPLRTGKPSRAKRTELAPRRNLRVQLLLERITGRSQDRPFSTSAVRDGIEREPDAVAMYEAITGTLLDNSVGFVAHDSCQAGCSPDGVVGDFIGIIEIKSPIAATHLEYLRTGKIPREYLQQIQHSLWITGAAWCDWLSYQPEFPEKLQVKLQRVPRDEEALTAHGAAIVSFDGEVERECSALMTMADLPGTLKAAVA